MGVNSMGYSVMFGGGGSSQQSPVPENGFF